MKSFRILGVRVCSLDETEAVDFVIQKIERKQSAQIATVNNEFIIEAQKNSEFREVINNSDLAIIDSVGLKWAIKHLYKKNVKRIPGMDFVLELCKVSSDRGYRIFLFGGSSGVGQDAKNVLTKAYPEIQIVGVIDGINIDANKPDFKIIKTINDANADVVFVALGAPKQDIWIARNISKMKAGVFIGVGGSLDYISGRVRRAPRFLRKIGLEWLFRLIIQPSRIGRIFKATIVFPLMIIFKKNRQLLTDERN